MASPTLPVSDFQRDQILTAAIRLTGILRYGQTPSPAQISAAAMSFQLVLDELQMDNVSLVQKERTTQALTDGTASYTLAAGTLDIALSTGDLAGYITNTAGDNIGQVHSMTLDEYRALDDNTEEGIPTRVYVEKQNTTKLLFWPVPSSSTYTFNYVKIRLLNQSDSGDCTMDLRRIWAPYCVFATAVYVALDNSMPEKAAMFKRWADEKKALARVGDSEQGRVRFSVRHNGRNW